MKTAMGIAVLALAWFICSMTKPTARAGATALAQDVDRGPVCSDATLHGRYAFLRTGQNNDLPGPIAQLGVTIFDGRGTATGFSLVTSRNGRISGAEDIGSAPYVVNADCTGYIVNPDGTPGDTYVVVNHGEKIVGESNLPGRVVTFILEEE